MQKFLVLALLVASLAAVGQSKKDPFRTADSLVLIPRYADAEFVVQNAIHTAQNDQLRNALQNKLAEIWIAEGKISDAEKLLNELKSFTWAEPKSEANYQTAIGNLQLNKGRYDLALESLQKAHSIFEANNLRASREAAKCLSLLGLSLFSSGKYNQAEEYGVMALQIQRETAGDESEEVAAAYNDLGLIYSQIDADKALSYYDLALPIYEKLHGDVHPKIAIINTNMGALYNQLKLYGDAINNFETALKIWRAIYPNGHPNEAFVLRFLGQTYVRMGNNTAAYQYFEQSVDRYKKSYGEKHPDIASTLNQVAELKLSDRAYPEALKTIQNALCANIPTFNNKDVLSSTPVNSYYNPQVLLFSLELKAQAFEELHYGKTLKLSDLKLALANLYLCDSLIDDIRHHSTDESDKISLGAIANEVYEDGVRIATAMSEMVLNPTDYREQAFYFAEKSKSAVLQESIADAQAKSFSGIPEALLNEEQELKSAITFLTQKLSQKPSAEEEKYLRESLFQLNKDYQAFTRKLETSYPNYYNLKFNYSSPTVSDLQKMLASDQAVVSFFVGEDSKRIFQFLITRKSFNVKSFALPPDFERSIKGTINSIYYRNAESLAKATAPLQKILVPKLPSSIKEMVIIPSGRLGTLPFEALPYKKVKGAVNAEHFLVNRYAISYEFSAGLMIQKSKGGGAAMPSIFLCAPVEFPEKDNLSELPGTESEVKTISQLFPGNQSKIITRTEANEAAIKSGDLSRYSYLHFATHGVVDETDPELSRIFLNAETHEDGNLYAGEIYNLQLNAELAVLSACQTGLGKFSKGEGVIGLSRALVYAGAKNLMVSFWSVADESTAQLMTDFYSLLLKDPKANFRKALQGAKTKMIKEGKYVDPYFWAPFVMIGN